MSLTIIRYFISFILLSSFAYSGYSQTFLKSYKKYRLERADKIANSKSRNKIKRFIKSQIVELDTIFQAYKAKTNFDFNTADTLCLIYDTPIQSLFTSDIIIWSGNDTISYKQGFETSNPFKPKRIIKYEPFLRKVEVPKGFTVITERDSVLKLVAKKDFNTLNHIGDNQKINDGGYYSIFIVSKSDKTYKFEAYFPKQFVIPDIYRVKQ